MNKASLVSAAVAKKHSLTDTQRVDLWKHLNTIPRGKEDSASRKIFFQNLLEDRDFAIKVSQQHLEHEDGEVEDATEEKPSEEQVEEALELFFALLIKEKKKEGIEKVKYYLRNYCNYTPEAHRGKGKEEIAKYKADNVFRLFLSLRKDHFEKEIFAHLKKGRLPPMV